MIRYIIFLPFLLGPLSLLWLLCRCFMSEAARIIQEASKEQRLISVDSRFLEQEDVVLPQASDSTQRLRKPGKEEP